MTFQDEEVIYSRLFTLLSATQQLTAMAPNGTALFNYMSRKVMKPDQLTPARMPALFQMEGEIEYGADWAGLSVDKYRSIAVVYFRSDSPEAGELPSMKLNAIRNAVHYQMRYNTLSPDGTTVKPLIPGTRQTLGGVCYHATLDGVGPANEGILLKTGGVVFPITILAGI
jgi:hypothetical protein